MPKYLSRWTTTAREGLTAAVRPTAASRHPVSWSSISMQNNLFCNLKLWVNFKLYFKVSFETIFFSFQLAIPLTFWTDNSCSFQLKSFFFFIIWESLSPCRCWVCLLRQGCPLLWSSLVHPLSVYTYICFSLSEWDCSLSEWDGNLSSPSSVSFPNPFAPHFLSVYSLYCHYLDLGHHMDAIFKFANNILNNLRNTGINPLFPLNGKKYRLFHFLDHSLITFISFENQMTVPVGVVMQHQSSAQRNVTFPLNYITARRAPVSWVLEYSLVINVEFQFSVKYCQVN